MLESLTIVVAHHMCEMPPYPYLDTDYGADLKNKNKKQKQT